MRICFSKRLLALFCLLSASIPKAALADWTAGTNAVVSNITHTSASLSASITTDANGTGEYTLYFYIKEVGATAEFFPAATPQKIPVAGNVKTTFTGTATSLACGRNYQVTGAYQLGSNGSTAKFAGPGYTTFSTLPCASVSPASITLKHFLGTAISPVVFTTANFNGTPTFQVTPSLPSGLTLNVSTGAITGTPTGAQTETRYTIRATGAVSGTTTATLALTVAPVLTDLDVLRYVASHPDLISAFGTSVTKARQHYLDWGYNEGRKITFEPLSYTASHTDLIAAFGVDEEKAVTHYIQWGFKEGRQVTFKPLNYIASHADLIGVFGVDAGKGVRHYIEWGFKEGRKVTFDPLRYTASHPDLIGAFGSDETKAVTHYIQFGSKENRQTTFSDLDALQFIASYADLITSLGADIVSGIKNYVEVGYQSGRRVTFDALAYIASHGDLIAAFGADAMAGVKHYINFGYKEGRKVVFDALGYLAANSDVRAAFGTDTEAATKHYMSYGIKEGRNYLWTVTVNTGKGGKSQIVREYVQTGRTVFFFIDAATGYRIGNATGCNGTLYKILETQATYTTGPIVGTCSVKVTFDELKPIIWLSDAGLDFGELTVSLTSQYKTVTVRNNGNTFLTIGQIKLTGEGANQYLISSSCGTVIPAGSGCSVALAFKPTSSGKKTASLAITHNAASGTTLIPISGVGSEYLSKCNNCVELRQVKPGDQWLLSVTEQEVGVVSPVGKEFKVDRVASIGPIYSTGGSKTQGTVRITDTYSFAGAPSRTQYFDYASNSGDSRLRMLGRGEVNGDGWAISAADFDAGNYPAFLVSPIGVGAEWAFEADFWGPPCFGCLPTTKQIERFSYRASVKAVDIVQTPIGNLEALRIEYSIICRRGYSSTSFGPNMECVSSDKYLGEMGTIWVNQKLGIIQQDTVISSGYAATSTPLRTRIVGKLVSTNIR